MLTAGALAPSANRVRKVLLSISLDLRRFGIQNKQTNNMITFDHVIYEHGSWRSVSFVSRHKGIFEFRGIFRFLICIFHLGVSFGIIFGQFNFLIDLEFGNDECFWFFWVVESSVTLVFFFFLFLS